MAELTAGFGGFRLIGENEGRFVSRSHDLHLPVTTVNRR